MNYVVPAIVQYVESLFSVVTEIGTDCSESESEGEAPNDSSEYMIWKIRGYFYWKNRREIFEGLHDYLELYKANDEIKSCQLRLEAILGFPRLMVYRRES
ncbi:hypothetical protein H5410_004027 [Solanum commersonii]|uniref:Uncharacterized protein n=1 Tax=Solanum commersonii TaxID=4109 RepID=A0A9J6B6G8_SOLCO|nr:hypothetical protein H5410_004027 [Solanum commersonii]